MATISYYPAEADPLSLRVLDTSFPTAATDISLQARPSDLTNATNSSSPEMGAKSTVSTTSSIPVTPPSTATGAENGRSSSSLPTTAAAAIAICGLGLRLPGGVHDASTLWSVLHNGVDTRSPIPPTRFNASGFDASLGSNTGTFSIRHGYFLDDDLGACLDTSFFSCCKTDLEKMDPQARLLLEVTRECLDNAGETGYRGSRIGCYVGTFGDDWMLLQAKEGLQATGGYRLTLDLLLANRVSYEFDFRGPSVVIKTGCSASMVAVHEACRALQAGDIEAAVVGGTSIILSPYMFSMMATDGILSPEGSCKPFDASADGFGRGEAVNALYLKRFEDAVRDGNPIRAVIRGSGTNSNGRNANGLISPDSQAQAGLIRSVYDAAGLDPCETAYIECHGTGTAQGDREEALAVADAFGNNGIHMGSLKANFGHSEGASGITSLIKAVLSLEKRAIPPQIKFNTPNPNIPFKEKRLVVPVEPTPWPIDRSKRVSVNSFGIGGSNAHIVLESLASFQSELAAPLGPPRVTLETGNASSPPALLVLSANSAGSLQQLTDSMVEYHRSHPECLQDLAYTLALRRETLQQRGFVVIGRDHSPVHVANVVGPEWRKPDPKSPPKLAMVFSGQGAQWPQMGLGHLQHDSEFRSDILSMDAVLQGLRHPPSWSLYQELAKGPETSRINEAEISQPLCTALQVALVRSLARKGIRPDAVIGHSSGEIAAGYTAGILSLSEAITAAYYRGFVMKDMPRNGTMAAIGLGSADVAPFLVGEGAAVVVAAENSPDSTTISGDVLAIEHVVSAIKETHPEVLCKKLVIDKAYHSRHHMTSPATRYLQHLQEDLEAIATGTPRLPMYSTVFCGAPLDSNPIELSYWSANLTSPVKFSAAAAALMQDLPGCILVEVGPHAQLRGPLRQIASAQRLPVNHYLPTSIRNEDCQTVFLKALGGMWQLGLPVNLASFLSGGKTLWDLPNYPWDHSGPRYWHETRVSKAWRTRAFGHHSLLGQRIPETSDLEPSWRVILDLENEPWLADHKVKGDIVFPFAGYVAMAGEAIRQLTRVESGYSVRHVVANSALLLHQSKPVEMVTSLRPHKLTDSTSSAVFHRFSIASFAGSSWVSHCEGLIRPNDGPPPETADRAGRRQPSFPRKVSTQKLYASFGRIGVQFGPAFKRLLRVEASTTEDRAVAEVGLPPAAKGGMDVIINEAPFLMHPTALDAFFQLTLVAMARGSGKNIQQLAIPSVMEEIDVFSPWDDTQRGACDDAVVAQPPLFYASAAVLGNQDHHQNTTTVEAWTANGTPVFRLDGLKFSRLDDDDDGDALNPDKYFSRHAACRLAWHPHFDFVDASTLIKPPAVDPDARLLLEELTLLLVLDAEAIVGELPEPLEPTCTRQHHQKLKQWLQRSRQEALESRHPVIDATTVATLVSMDSSQRADAIPARFAELAPTYCGTISSVMRRVYDRFSDLITGRVEAIELLMADDLLADMYSSISFDVSPLVHSLCVTKPGLRILEVGAGTGGTTAAILGRIITPGGHHPPYATYMFTDVSAAFFPQARERFSFAPNMEYATLDASANPLEQGFEAASYDLIVASNVIHALPSLRTALENMRSLLRPGGGGQILLQELCGVLQAPTYVFGHFSGWWLGEEDGRLWAPHVPVKRWDTELRMAGFTGVNTVVLDAEAPLHLCGVIVSATPSPPPPPPVGGEVVELERHDHHGAVYRGGACGRRRIAILHTDPSAPVIARLTSDLASQGHREVVMVRLGDLPPPDAVVVATLDHEPPSPFFDNISADRLGAFQHLCRNYGSKELLWLMPPTGGIDCPDPRAAQTMGALGVFRNENNLPFFTLGIRADEENLTGLVLQTLNTIGKRDDDRSVMADREFLVHGGLVHVARLEPFSLREFEPSVAVAADSAASSPGTGTLRAKVLEVGEVGVMSSLRWRTQLGQAPPRDGEVAIDVKAVGLNFKDVLAILGALDFGSSKVSPGLEIAGVVSQVGDKVENVAVGDRVAYFSPLGCFSTRLVVDAAACVKIPDTMGFEEAAAATVAYFTVVHALLDVAQLDAGQTVLIHSGCGGVGLAAIQLCKMMGAEVYITVGTQEKIGYAVNKLGIARDRIFSSRDDSFVQGVMQATGGRGVDVVLNSLSGSLLHASWRCVAEFGKMIEIGKADIVGNGYLEMAPFLLNRSYCCVDMSALALKRPLVARRALARSFEYISQGKLKGPDKITVFDATEVEKAYRWLQDGDHIGKAVVRISEISAIPARPSDRQRLRFDSAATYLITGGLGGLGRSVSTWMAEQGARSIIFLSPSAGKSAKDNDFLHELGTLGCCGIAVAGQAEVLDHVRHAVSQAPSPIRGVIHLAMVQREGMGVELSHHDWQAAVRPKVDGAWNLHNCLADTHLDFFIMTSSVLTIGYQPGESNYAAASSFLEAFTQYRRGLGLPSSTLVVSALAEVGYIEENPAAMRKVRGGGYYFLAEREFLDFMEYSIRHQKPKDDYTTNKENSAGLISGGYVAMAIHSEVPLSDPQCRVSWRRDARLGSHHNLRAEGSSESQHLSTLGAAADLLSRARVDPRVLSEPATVDIVAVEIGRRVRTIMMMQNPDDVDVGQTLQQVGVDSLMAVELRRWWKLTFGVNMTTLEIMSGGTLSDLGSATVEKIKVILGE